MQLHDGSLYNIKIISCNGANLFDKSVLMNVLVDTSPPISGTFAINSDHAVTSKLDRQSENWMIWEPSRIHLAWLGFSDIHSGLLEYHVNIGSSYMAADLNENVGTSSVVNHQVGTEDNGFIQTEVINTQDLSSYGHIFISMWVVNRVGLNSKLIHSQFYLVPGGSLQLVRRCESNSCQGHCVCAAEDLKCTLDEAIDCVDMSGDASYANIEIEDVINMSPSPDDYLLDTHTPTDTMLSAKWSVKTGAVPLWYEWSVGLADSDQPVGIFNGHERIWHDAGQLLCWTFTLPNGIYLVEGEQYSFFLRAWFNENTFSDFKSRGVIVQTTPPETTALFGTAVKEVRDTAQQKDVDFIAPDDILLVVWKDKFKHAQTSVSRYRLYISSEPNGHDVHLLDEDILPSTTMYNLTGIYNDVDTKFYTNMIAYNHAGLHTITSSDGCRIDQDTPVTGVVYDGIGLQDRRYQNSSNIVSASWHGFVDLGSSLQSYHWCVSPMSAIGSCSVLPVQNVGLATKKELQLSLHVSNGEELVNEVFATDQVGHVSKTVLSDGVVVDNTPPVRLQHLKYANNLLFNPSFESSESPVRIENLTITHSCHHNSPTSWVIADNSCAIITTAAADIVQDGTMFLALNGSISQTVTQLNPGSLYRLTFYTSYLPLNDAIKANNEGFVEFDDNKNSFMLYTRPNRSDHSIATLSWHLHTMVFKPLHTEVNIRIWSYENRVGIAIDNIQLQESIASDEENERAEGHVNAHMVFLHSWSSIHASWNFYDAESGLKEYLWAIGTVQGGIQLQEFKSVGVQPFGTNSDIYLPHNTTVYISVVAINGAGLRTISYSDPLLIDLTPPEFDYVNDGFIKGRDNDFQTTLRIGVNFLVNDLESGISSCSWGIGIQKGDISLQQFKELKDGQTSAEAELPESTSSNKIFVTVRCINRAGLVATSSSDGVTILKDNIISESLVVEILGHSPSHFPVHSHFHGTADQFKIRWTGFGGDHPIKKYKINVIGPSQDTTSYVDQLNTGYTYATFTDLASEDGIYSIVISGINWLDEETVPVSTNVTVLTVSPKIMQDISITWNNSNEHVAVSWDGVFYSNFPLYYEVSVGNIEGSGDIIQWQETKSDRLIFKLPREDIGLYGKYIYATVTAITPAGTYTTSGKDMLIKLE